MAHLSWKPNTTGRNHFANAGGGYFGESFSSFIDYTTIGRNYYADMGFVNRIENYDVSRDTVIRQGTEFLFNETNYQINYRDNKFFNIIRFETENFLAFDEQRKFNERSNNLEISLDFKTTASLSFELENNDLNLLFPFRFVEDETSEPLNIGRYKFSTLQVEYRSDVRKNVFYNASYRQGGFYNADYTQLTLGFIGRNQPYVSAGINVEYNYLKFPDINGGKQEFLLIAPQLEWNFTNNLFWTSFLQYNTQSDNFNINSRIQWRYLPMSDLFVVYSDNYLSGTNFTNQNRALILKINYWLNG